MLDHKNEADLIIPNEETQAKLKEILTEDDFTRFIQFTHDIESKSIEQSHILNLEGDFSEKVKRT